MEMRPVPGAGSCDAIEDVVGEHDIGRGELRLDEIVPPGVTLNPADNGWVSPALQPVARRR